MGGMRSTKQESEREKESHHGWSFIVINNHILTPASAHSLFLGNISPEQFYIAEFGAVHIQ
jgi:hypothetical protein